MLEAGRCRSIAEIAEAEKVDRAYVSRLLDLTLLAPDIQEAILDGMQPKGIQLEELTRAMPGAWDSPPLIKRFCGAVTARMGR
jgi:ParB-like chromosome segregation protein Spo0J